MSGITLVAQAAAPSTPAAGQSVLYVKTNKFWYYKDDAGVEHQVSSILHTKEISGLTYANNAIDTANDIDIAVGSAVDSTNVYAMVLESAFTKDISIAWAVGTNQGGLDTGIIANADYHIWLIARSDTGVVDVLFSLSSTAPAMPLNYNYKRLIGWLRRTAGAIVAFITYETEGGGLEYNWTVPVLDFTGTLTTARRVDIVRVPTTFSVIAHLNVSIFDAVAGSTTIIYCPDLPDLVPVATTAPLGNSIINGTSREISQKFVRTSAAGGIASRTTLATVDFYAVATMGFTWSRRN